MNGRNPWRPPRDGDPRMTDATVDGDRPTDAPTPDAEGIEHTRFTEEETQAVTTVANWYAAWCRSVGRQPPPDRMRCILAIAVEVFMGEMAAQEQARRDAMGDDDDERDVSTRH